MNNTACTQEPGSVPGHYEQEAIKAASSAIVLTPDPAERCRTQLTLGKAHLALYCLHLGPAAGSDAWPQPDSLQAPVAAATSDGANDDAQVVVAAASGGASDGAQVNGHWQKMSDSVQHAS